MQSYHEMPTEDTTAMDFQYWTDYVADMKRYPVAPMTLKDCANPLCCHQSYAVYCSTYCLEAVEGTEEPAEADDYYHSADITLGHIATADAQYQADLAAGGFVALACGVQPEAAAVAAPAFSEAPVSCTVKGLHHGQDTMITIRGTDFASVQAQLEAACAWFDVPAAVVQPPVAPEPAHVCPVHHVAMERQVNAKGAWWSHRAADGWCKGRVQHG